MGGVWLNKLGDSMGRFQGIGAAGLVFTAALLLRQLGFLAAPELALYDVFLRQVRPRVETSPVVLVEIREADIQALGHWPVNDGVLARAIGEILRAGALVVGLDIYRDLPVPPGTATLNELLLEKTRIVSVRKFGGRGEPSVPGPPALVGTGRVGFNDLPLDGGEGRIHDATVRRALLYQDDGSGPPQESFALIVAKVSLADAGIELEGDALRPEWLRLGETTIPYFEATDGGYATADAAGYQMLLDFAAHGAFQLVSLTEVLRGEFPSDVFQGRVVLLGSNAISIPDSFPVPVGAPLPGLEIHGHAVDQLLRFAYGHAAPLRHLAEWQEIGLLALACLMGGLFGFGGPGRPLVGAASFLLGLASGTSVLLAGAVLAIHQGTWVPVAGPGIAGIASAGLATAWASSRERWQRNQLMQIFSRHMAPSVASEIWEHRGEVFSEGRVRPRRLTATVLFVDMRGYTAQSEKMEPDELLTWANAFMQKMADLVHRHGGVVDDYFGDGIKANFGVPLERRTEAEVADTAQDAVRCALEMAAALVELNREYASQGLPTCAARVGIHTGRVVVGSIGGLERLKYTTVGSVPVTAQRLEGTREVSHDFDAAPLRILVSDATRRHLGGEFAAVSVGEMLLSGQSEPIVVHRIETRNPGEFGNSEEGA